VRSGFWATKGCLICVRVINMVSVWLWLWVWHRFLCSFIMWVNCVVYSDACML